MADIFISYAHDELERVEPLVRALESRDWSVWWDREIRPGSSWDDDIEREVIGASCVVTVWTKKSVESRWVKNESMSGLERGVLVPVRLDDVDLPIAFKGTQVADLTQWSGDSSAPEFATFLDAVAAVLSGEPSRTSSDQPEVHVSRRPDLRWPGAAIAGVLTMSLAVWFWMSSNVPGDHVTELTGVDTTRPVPGFASHQAIAVLPFRDLTQTGLPLTQGLTQDVVSGLQRFRGFPVIAATTMQAYSDPDLDVRAVASEVGATYVLTGDVRQANDQLRVTAQVIDSAGRTIWSDRYEGRVDDLFSFQDAITSEIVGAIWPQYLEWERQRTRSRPNLSAWDNYVQGWANVFDSSKLKEGERLCREAVALDPGFAPAHVCVGHAIGMQLVGSTDPDEVVMDRLEEAFTYFETARELDPFDATACGCLVYWHTVLGNYDIARSEAEYGLDVNPSNHVLVRANGMLLLATGDIEGAIEQLKKAMRLNPKGIDTMDTIANLSTAMLASGNHEEGMLLALQAVHGDPDNPAYQTELIVALTLLGRQNEAKAAYATAVDRIPGFRMDSVWIRGWLKPLARDLAKLVGAGPDSSVGEALRAVQADIEASL